MKVVIDNIVYVPETTIEHAAPDSILKAIRSIVFCIDIYGPLSRGPQGCLFDALEALAPNLAKLYSETGSLDAVKQAIPGYNEG